MSSIRIWTPESDFDSKAVLCIAKKIVAFYDSDIKVLDSSERAYKDAVKTDQKDGLKKQVNIYLKTSDLVIFLIDYDGIQSHAERLKQPNSLVNKITEVVNYIDNAILIYIRQELEAWLLVDCMGICCYFTKDEKTRIKKDWIEFSTKNQRENTELIVESIRGGKGAKEYLVDFSDSINLKINPNLAKKLDNLKKKDILKVTHLKLQNILKLTSKLLQEMNLLGNLQNIYKDD